MLSPVAHLHTAWEAKRRPAQGTSGVPPGRRKCTRGGWACQDTARARQQERWKCTRSQPASQHSTATARQPSHLPHARHPELHLCQHSHEVTLHATAGSQQIRHNHDLQGVGQAGTATSAVCCCCIRCITTCPQESARTRQLYGSPFANPSRPPPTRLPPPQAAQRDKAHLVCPRRHTPSHRSLQRGGAGHRHNVPLVLLPAGGWGGLHGCMRAVCHARPNTVGTQ